MVNLEASAQVKRTTLLGYNLVYSISSEVVLGVSCCCVLSPFISHHDSRLFAELKLCGYLCCHFFLFSFYGFSQMQEWKCLLPVCLFSCRPVGADIWHFNVNCQWWFVFSFVFVFVFVFAFVLVFAFVTGMCLVVGRCVPVGETRTLTVNSAGESQRANLEPPSGCLLDGLGRTHCAPPAQQLRFRFTFNRRRGGEREQPAGEKACAAGLRTLVAEQQQQQQGHQHPPPWVVARALKLMSLHQGLHTKGQGFITHGVTR